MVASNVIPMEETPQVEAQPVPSKAVLYAKLARVLSKVQRIEKNGWNDFHKYEYATASDVYDGVRAALAEENVAFLPDMVKADKEGIHTRLEFDMYFCCGDTGAVKVSRWVSEADDKGDKGLNKAITFAVKYFLIATFLISTGDIADDPDGTAPEGEQGKAKPKQAKSDKPERRIDTTEKPVATSRPPEPTENGRKEPLFQWLMQHVKHERYAESKARAAAINKLMQADLIVDNGGNREALVTFVHEYAEARSSGLTENEAMNALRQRINRTPAQ